MEVRQFNIILQNNGDGPLVIHIPLHAMTGYIIPRGSVSEAATLEGIHRQGIYFLVGDNKIYIGQTRNGLTRIQQHLTAKDWWDRALLFLAPGTEFDLDTISGLEKTGIEKAFKNSPYEVMNKDMPTYEARTPYSKLLIDTCYSEIETILNVFGIKTKKAAGEDEAPVVSPTNVTPFVNDDFHGLFEDFEIKGHKVNAYMYNGVIHEVSSMTVAFTELVSELYAKDPNKFTGKQFSPWLNKDKSKIKVAKTAPDAIKLLDCGVYCNTNKSNDNKISCLKKMALLLNLSTDAISLRIV